MSDATSRVRQRILDAAWTAFARHGYGGASTSEIARLARVSKRDLYAQFDSKQAMLATCVLERAERMRRPLALPPPSDRAGLAATLIAYGTASLPERGRPEVLAVYRLAIQEAGSAPELAATLDRLGRGEALSRLTDLFADATARGLLRGAAPAEMARLFHTLLVGDERLVRMLMGVAPPPTEAEARARAERAVRRLFQLHGGADDTDDPPGSEAPGRGEGDSG
jgi:AcrR family transcriptional regulator